MVSGCCGWYRGTINVANDIKRYLTYVVVLALKSINIQYSLS